MNNVKQQTESMITRDIEAVLFDFGGVLAEEGWKQGFREIARVQDLDPERVLQAASDTVYETGYILGKATSETFWRALQQKTGIHGEADALRQEIFSRFILRDEMIALVKKLKALRFTVGILSDQVDMLDALNERFDFFKWFDHVFNSYHMGKGKRDATLFDDIAAKIHVPPGRILFVDDDEGHVGRAREKGWKAILYTDAASFCARFDAVIGLSL